MGTKTKTTSTQTAAPPSWTMPGITDAAGKVTSALATLPGEKYTGDFVAQPSQYGAGVADQYAKTAGLANSMAQVPLAAIQAGAQPVQYDPMQAQQYGGYQNMTPLRSFDPGTGGALQGAINSAVDPVVRQLQESTLPGLQSSAIASGAYGSDRAMNVLPGQAIRDATQSAQQIAATMAYQNANDTRNLMFQDQTNRQNLEFQDNVNMNNTNAAAFADAQARGLQGYGLATSRSLGEAGVVTDRLGQLPGLISSALQTSAGAGDIMAQAAAYDTQRTQAGIDNALAQNQYNMQYPFQGLDTATQLLARLSGNYGTTSGTQTQSSGGLGPIVQGLAGLGAMGASLASGGGAGGLSSLFGGGAASAAGIFKNSGSLQQLASGRPISFG